MNKYKAKGTCMYSGCSQTSEVFAESEQEVRSILLNRGTSPKSIDLIESDIAPVIEKNEKAKIVDAEELLFEMDMSRVDSITVNEGFGETTTHSREEVLNQVLSFENECKVKDEAIKKNEN